MSKQKTTSVVAIATLLGAFAVSEAHAQGLDWTPGPPTSDWTFQNIRLNYPEDSDGTLTGGQKYVQLQGGNYGSAGHCIEISTAPGASTTNPDTRIWIINGSGTLVSLSDDEGPGYQSVVRLWSEYGPYVFKIAAYSSARNSESFNLVLKRKDLTEANCTTGQALPWVKVKGFGQITYGNAT